uniref:Uncharacterized protein n=1 Tax=viral metagenome TaxID=1070528 RepID=A0A6H1ZS64_9ZZZZ
MNTIKFSHPYKKLEVLGFHNEIGRITRATLLDVLYVQLESLSQKFLNYDTDNGKYKLPKRGLYLLLLFAKNEHDLFTTLRRCTPEKERYYRSKIGETFAVEVETTK